mgnify:FL=1
MREKLVYSVESYEALGGRLSSLLGGEVGSVERRRFPDGERYLRLRSDVRGRDVVLVGGTPTEGDTLELFDLASGIVKYGARSLSLVAPYFGYATMERATDAGEIVTAKNRARLLSSIPQADAPNRIFLLDAHTEGLPYYFEGSIVPVHVYGKDFVLRVAKEMASGTENLVLACTDAGRAKWVESLANDLGVPASFVFKRRIDGATTQITAVSAQVHGKTVVIYDDMIRTGGSLMQAARAYLDAGAARVAAIATHGIMPGDSLERLAASKIFEKIAVTDSHPRAVELAQTAGGFLHVESCAGLIAARIRAHD